MASALTRLAPIFPYTMLNYALGLTKIPTTQYVAATAICMLPGAAAYAYLGDAGRRAWAGEADAIQHGLIALALLAVVIFTAPWLARKLRSSTRREPVAEDHTS